jgi:hypothetical protein
MELTGKTHAPIDPPLDSAALTGHLRLLFDESPVRGYRLTLTGGSDFHSGPRKAPIVIICLTEMVTDRDAVMDSRLETGLLVNNKFLKKRGDYIFVQPGNEIKITNMVKPAGTLALFELK